MPTPKTWTDRAADILLDERNKRYLGMTDRPTATPGCLVCEGWGAYCDKHAPPASDLVRCPECDGQGVLLREDAPDPTPVQTPPASGPLDVDLALRLQKIADDLVPGIRHDFGLEAVARLTAATSASDQEAEV